jgi:hypothetical protein
VVEQRERVLGEDVRRVGGRVMGTGAVPVPAQVRHDDPVPACGEAGSVAVLHPVDPPGREEAVQQDERPALARLAVGEPGAVPGTEAADGQVLHPHSASASSSADSSRSKPGSAGRTVRSSRRARAGRCTGGAAGSGVAGRHVDGLVPVGRLRAVVSVTRPVGV